MKSRLACMFLLLAVSWLAGCAQQATPTPRPPEPTAEASATPDVPTPVLLPRDNTPQPGLGIVEGMLSLGGEPAAGQVLYLAAIIRPEGEGMGVAALDPANDPRIESDATGYFAFLDIEPQRYALGIMSPGGPVLIQQNGAEIIADVQAGQVTDLGTVQIVPFTQ